MSLTLLSDQQYLFAQLLSRLLQRLISSRKKFVVGEVFRTALQAWAYSLPPGSTFRAVSPLGDVFTYAACVGGVGILASRHCDKLAADILLFDNHAVISDPAAYKIFGDYWESLNANCRWGGRFKKPDIYHFEYNPPPA